MKAYREAFVLNMDGAYSKSDAVIRVSDGAWIPNDPGNMDRIEHLAWRANGNDPDPYVAAPKQQQAK